MDLGPEHTEIPAYVYEQHSNYSRLENLAQYKGSDYANAIRVERGITLSEAFAIADQDPNIDYFVFTKGGMMVLEIPSETVFDPAQDPLHLVTAGEYMTDDGQSCTGYTRLFRYGDVVFFKNDGKWLGSAPGLADVYVKETK
jgi:hypothetical protein